MRTQKLRSTIHSSPGRTAIAVEQGPLLGVGVLLEDDVGIRPLAGS